jgi:hypothetical protein
MNKTNQNPLEDKKWLKELAEKLKKDQEQVSKSKEPSSNWVSEIICTQEDIGEPNYPKNKK